MDDFRTPGDGSFSLGSRTWPGLSKVIEECGEVLQVAGKLMGTAGNVEHWDGAGPLDVRIAEEMCDLFAACVAFFQLNGFDGVEEYVEREADKYQTFLRWHAEGLKEPEDKVTEPDTGIPKDLRDRLIEAWNFGQFADDLNVPLAGSIRADIRQLCNVLERMPFAAPARRSSPQAPAQVEARVTMPQAITDPDPLHLSRILHELAGAASLCWEPRPTGVFDSQLAIQFVEQALAEIRSRMTPAPAEVLMPDDDMSDALGKLAGVDTHDVNLRDNPESYEILGRLLHTYGDAREAAGYARGLKEAGQDAERYRWLRRHFAIVGTDNGAVFHALNLPTPTHIAPDAAIELDASIDAALRGEVKP